MAIQTSDDFKRRDNRVLVWGVVALLAIAALAYAGYQYRLDDTDYYNGANTGTVGDNR